VPLVEVSYMTFKVKRQNLKKIRSKYKMPSEEENLRKKILHTYIKEFSRSYESIGKQYNVSRVTVYRRLLDDTNY
jgi:DNA invertase Pin-like site-specific DNA recombinase